MKQKSKITFLAHSGFVFEFSDCAFVFDYYKGNLPDSLKDKKLYVFASHFHQDHFDKKILEWAGDYRITYILSRDIKLKQLKEVCALNPNLHIESFEKTEISKMEIGKNIDNSIYRVIPRKEYQIGDLEIFTLRSTDVGVAFLVKYMDYVIYHAGDLNWWRWEGESQEFNERMEECYVKELQILKKYLKKHNLCIDVAFLPLDYRQEADYFLGFDSFMKNINANVAIPMHMWGVYKVIPQLLESEESASYRDKIWKIEKRGESLELC